MPKKPKKFPADEDGREDGERMEVGDFPGDEGRQEVVLHELGDEDDGEHREHFRPTKGHGVEEEGPPRVRALQRGRTRKPR